MAQDYTYLVARLRAMEASMPDAAWFQRVSKAGPGEALNSVREYYSGFEGVDSLYGLEDGIERERSKLLGLLDSLIEDDGVRTFLRAGYDFTNLVHALKASRLGAPASMNGFGLVDPEAIGRAVSGVSTTDIPAWLRDCLEKLESAGETADPAVLEALGEKAKWEFLLSTGPGEAARHHTRCRIDLLNIKMFIRMKRNPVRKGDGQHAWIEGGEIDAQTLTALFREPEDELHSYLAFTSHRGLAARGLGTATPPWMLDVIATGHLLAMTGDSRYRFFDIGPVLYHMTLRERDEQLLRMILTGILNRLPEERILEGVEAMTA